MSYSARSESPLRQRLKDSTRALHDQVEATNFMGRLMRDDLTAPQYARTMSALHAIYGPLEVQLSRVEGLAEVLPDLTERLKTGSLEADLRDLAILDPDLHAPVVHIEPLRAVPEALGTLYVLEGSTMGARLIAAKLKTRPFVRADRLNFFEHYHGDSGRYWQRFTQCLETVAEADHDAVVAAAQRTFGYFISLSESPRTRDL